MSEQHDIAGPILAHLRTQHRGDGTVAWPGDLTEDEQVAYMALLQDAGILDGALGLISFSPSHARESIALGRFAE